MQGPQKLVKADCLLISGAGAMAWMACLQETKTAYGKREKGTCMKRNTCKKVTSRGVTRGWLVDPIGPWRWAFAGCCWLALMGHGDGPQKDNDGPVLKAEYGPENVLGP